MMDSASADALRKIAKGTFTNKRGDAQRFARQELINLARDACYTEGIIWSSEGPPSVPRGRHLKPGDENV